MAGTTGRGCPVAERRPAEEERRIYEAYQRLGSQRAVAAELGLQQKAVSTCLKRLRREADNGAVFDEGAMGALAKLQAPPGRRIGKVTLRTDLTTGEHREAWTRVERDREPAQDAETAAAELRALAGDVEIPRLQVPPPRGTIDEWLATYWPTDLHGGMLAWKPDAGGDYDLKIARRAMLEPMRRLVSQVPRTETALVVVGGDTLHAETNEWLTLHGKHHLDGDGRFEKVAFETKALLIESILLLLAHHKRVVVRVLKGNHDENGAWWLALLLDAWFNREPRVEVILDPSPWFVWTWQDVMFVMHHGDKLKLPAGIRDYAITHADGRTWGRHPRRYGYHGHLHSKRVYPETPGIQVEGLRAIAAKDAWAWSKALLSERTLHCRLVHATESRTRVLDEPVRLRESQPAA